MSKFGARVSRASRGPPRYPCVALIDAWDARRAARTRTGCGDAYGTRIRTQLYFKCYCACRRHQGCHCRKTETSVRLRFFGQLSDKPVLARIRSHGVPGAKRNGWSKIKRWAPTWRIGVAQLAIGVAAVVGSFTNTPRSPNETSGTSNANTGGNRHDANARASPVG